MDSNIIFEDDNGGPPSRPLIYNLTVYEDKIYASGGYSSSLGKLSVSEYPGNEQSLYSSDGGKTWDQKLNIYFKVTFNLPDEVIEELNKFPTLPVNVCLPDNSNICYGIDQESIIQSMDGGKTWKTSWDIPLEHREILENSSPPWSLGPYDLVLLPFNGKNSIVAAIGSGGIIVKTDDGEWQNIQVWDVGPLPEYEAEENATVTP